MGQLKFYSNYINNMLTPNQNWRTLQQEFVNEAFDNTTIKIADLYEEGVPFDFEFNSNPECWVGTVLDVSTGIVKNSDDYRSVYFKNLEHEAQRGRYYKWNNNYWLVYETTNDLETISTCNIRRCNNWLKWLNNKGEVLQYPCVIEGTLSSANAQVAKTITQANSHIDVIVQGNADTLDFFKNARVIFNGCVYRFYSINNYMQNDYVDKDTPLLFMDFFLDMLIDEDNIDENLADDRRDEYTVECNINSINNVIGTEGIISTQIFHNNTEINGSRLEYTSSDESVVTVDASGNYKLISNGTAIITVNIKGNTIAYQEIAVEVSDTVVTTYELIISPIITYLKQGLTKTITATVIDNSGNNISTNVTVVASGTDNNNNYTLIDLGNNSWTLKNNLMSNKLLILTFTCDEYSLTKTMQIDLKAMI